MIILLNGNEPLRKVWGSQFCKKITKSLIPEQKGRRVFILNCFHDDFSVTIMDEYHSLPAPLLTFSIYSIYLFLFSMKNNFLSFREYSMAETLLNSFFNFIRCCPKNGKSRSTNIICGFLL